MKTIEKQVEEQRKYLATTGVLQLSEHQLTLLLQERDHIAREEEKERCLNSLEDLWLQTNGTHAKHATDICIKRLKALTTPLTDKE